MSLRYHIVFPSFLLLRNVRIRPQFTFLQDMLDVQSYILLYSYCTIFHNVLNIRKIITNLTLGRPSKMKIT